MTQQSPTAFPDESLADVPAVFTNDSVAFWVPTQTRFIGPIVAHLRRRLLAIGFCDADRADRIHLALHEAVTNAMVHGNLGVPSSLKLEPDNAFARLMAERSADPALAARRVDIRFDFDGERAEFVIADQGAGFDATEANRTDENDAPSSSAAEPDIDLVLPSGRGILIMKAFTDGLRYDDGGRRLTLTCWRDPASARRRHRRRPLAQSVRVLPLRDDGSVDFRAAFEALARNISEGGLALVHANKHTATRMLVEVHGGEGPIYLPAEIRRITTTPDGLVQIGARFVTPVSDTSGNDPVPATTGQIAELLGWVDSMLPADERRIHGRIGVSMTVVARDEGSRQWTVLSRDLSTDGMAFVASTSLPLGTAKLRVPAAGGNAAEVEVDCQIVRCRKVADGLYDVGCRLAA